MPNIRLPAALYSHYGQHLVIWLFARALDDSALQHGDNLGCGRASFALKTAAAILNRSISHVRRLLAGAKAKGLLRDFATVGGDCVCYYSSMERVARAAGLKELGAVSEISLEDLKNLRVAATETTAQALQQSSYWAAKEAEKTRLENRGSKLKPQLIKPERIFDPPCEHLARVLGRNGRILYVSEGFIAYGASQEGIARRRGISTRTVQRHLSNQYRTQPSPVRGYRSELEPCDKVQVAQRVRRGFSPKLASRIGGIKGSERLIHGPHDRYFYLRCNIYYPYQRLVRVRYRRREFDKLFLSKEKSFGGGGL